MITTLSAMRKSRSERLIIGRPMRGWMALLAVLLPALLGGCSSVRLAYANASQLSWWWIDGYVDFSSAQSPAVRQDIDRFFEWHRTTQLPELVRLLAGAQAQVVEPATAAQACGWQDQVREKLEPALQRAMQVAAGWVPALGEAQFRQLEQRYEKSRTEMRQDFLQADAAERLAQSVQRAVERAEQVYGRLGEAQRRVVREGVAASPFNPELWLAERQARQRDVVQTLRQLVADRADAEQRVAALQLLVQRAERSPDPVYRAYQLKLAEYNCGFAAQIHNATTPAQRQRARETLKGWETDLRSFIPAG
jgi:hypothetical protein